MTADTNKRPGSAIIILIVVALALFSMNHFALAGEPVTTDGSFFTGENPDYGGIYDDYARLIAGMAVSKGPIAPLETRPAWVEYSRSMRRGWMNLDKRLLSPERSWSQRELGDAASSEGAVFYPFSGPDFANVNAFFPKAKTYVLIALEPLGDIPGFPSMTPVEFKSYFESFRDSLHDLLNVNYFLSAHMADQIEKTDVGGVLPILLFMLAQNKAQVKDVRYWTMGMDGGVREFPALETTAREFPAIRTTDLDMNNVAGVRIVFTAADSEDKQPQTLYYFHVNLYNQAFDHNRHFLDFLSRLGPFTTFMKSASYVMFDPKTSTARQFMLDHSSYIVQEDSGIPVKYFEPSVWRLRFYGHYLRPISTFKEACQKDLASIYKADKQIKPLPFGFGYFCSPGAANLMFAERKLKDPARDEAPGNDHPDDSRFLYNNAIFQRRNQGS